MEVKHIQYVLALARMAADTGLALHHTMPIADADAAIAAVEAWLREIGALPPR